MRMLRWIYGHIRMDRVRNDGIRDRLGISPIEEKLVQHRLRWFGPLLWMGIEESWTHKETKRVVVEQ